MRKILLLTMLIPLHIMAQNNSIHFETQLNWEQVKAKAKKENKYIFLDCYATWCAPCKRMEKDVYTNDTVGSFFNKNFISVKVQMDETEKDTKEIKSWRNDAASIAKQYKVLAYPTYIFLSSEGSIIHMESGFKPPSDFLAVAQIATAPGKVYDNPFATYDRLLVDYKKDKKDYSKMPYMLKTALKLKEIETAKTIAADYSKYVIKLKNEDLYTKENIDFFTTVISSKSNFFHLFFPDGSRIDSTVNKKGYAQNIVDEVILTEEVEPFIQMKTRGMQIMGVKPHPVTEPKWENLYQIIANKYNADYAKRNVLDAQIIWNEHQQNLIYTAYFVQRWETYGFDTTTEKTDLRLNQVAWDIFIKVLDKRQIDAAINWMQGVVRRSASMHPAWMATTTDTYACLLYKAGKKQEAIQWEKMAINNASLEALKEFKERVNQMEKNEQIWP